MKVEVVDQQILMVLKHLKFLEQVVMVEEELHLEVQEQLILVEVVQVLEIIQYLVKLLVMVDQVL